MSITHLHRRDLLRQSAAAVTALVAGPYASPLFAVDPPKSGPSFGLVTYMIAHDWDLATLIANCEKTEVLGAELRTTHKHGVEPSLSAQQRKEAKKRFADSRVTLVGLGSNENFDNPDPAILRKAIDTTKEFVKLAHDLGTSGVKVKPNDFHKDVPREKTIQQIGESLLELGKFAADYDQQIRLEVHGQCAELPTIKQIIDIADHPNVAVCWNSNVVDLRGEGLEHNFSLVRNRFGNTCHVRRLDSSDYPFQQLIALLVKTDYRGWVLLEDGKPAEDRIGELIEQRKLFEQFVTTAIS
jgi:endonuclease IV